jgi:methionyl-tRNA synthetase
VSDAKPFYITTPIYYVNDVPHLGHAYTTIAADTLARYHRMRGDQTRFLTGTDEHGQKIEEAATKAGRTAREHVDAVAPRFAECWHQLGIQYDDFIRTTEDRHQAVVRVLWDRMLARGDLYLAAYEGWYCVGCEAFYTESQLVKDGADWTCPTHKRPTTWVAKERSWFFRLGNYAQALLDHIEQHPHFIQPDAYRSEVVSFLRGGLRDLSVSRTSFSWGIPVPTPDPEGQHHVMYVWLDALTNYLSALGPIDGPLSATFWPRAVHLIGKDILRFHAVYWPAFLLSAGLPLPRTIYCHGWWTVRGEKISKSLPATRIDPVKLAGLLAPAGWDEATSRLLGVDALRYYLLREIPLGNDGDFTFESLLGRYNAELANDLGNLVTRCLTLLPRLLAAGRPPARDAALGARPLDLELAAIHAQAVADTGQYLEAFAPHRALEATWVLVRAGNRYVDQSKPWELAKQPAGVESAHVAHVLASCLTTIAQLIAPVLPAASAAILTGLGAPTTPRWPGPDLAAWSGAATFSTDKAVPMFPRLDDKAAARIVAAMVPPEVAEAPAPAAVSPAPAAAPAPAKASPAAPPAAPGAAITYEQFMATELRVGHVLAAAPVPKAKKLLQLTVDLGEGRHRTIVAGIAEAYAPEVLVGRKVIVVANLAPATIRGIMSEGMILAAGDEAILGLSALDRDVPAGTRVR